MEAKRGEKKMSEKVLGLKESKVQGLVNKYGCVINRKDFVPIVEVEEVKKTLKEFHHADIPAYEGAVNRYKNFDGSQKKAIALWFEKRLLIKPKESVLKRKKEAKKKI